MNLAWSVLALALVGMDDPGPISPHSPSCPFTINGSPADEAARPKLSADTTATPSACCPKSDAPSPRGARPPTRMVRHPRWTSRTRTTTSRGMRSGK